MRLVLITGLSGSGKSIALKVLEDAGYYCVDNLPSLLLPALVDRLSDDGCDRVAVAIDVRSGGGIVSLPAQVDALRRGPVDVRFLFVIARDDILIKRFSETRRRHPLASETRTLREAIREERRLLEGLFTIGHHIDTSELRPSALREWVREFIALPAGEGLTLLFQSFGFKHGLPLDADLVFDVRPLPNPHYEPDLKPKTGQDAEVIAFLEGQEAVIRMRDDIHRFIADWLPSYIRDDRSYLTVAIGCTGGQHRSVYFAEWLAAAFKDQARVLVRHRQLVMRP